MIAKAKPSYVREARRLIGKKAALTGGGMFIQYIYVVKVEDVTKDGHAVLKLKGWEYPYGKTVIFKPLLMSWRVIPLAPGFKNLPSGRYDLLAGVRDKPSKPFVSLKRRWSNG